MKTDLELAKYISDRFISDKHCSQQPMYKMVITGDVVSDFAKFTDLQSGKKSNDPDDPAAFYFCPVPYKDGQLYHTIRDITADTFRNINKMKRLNLTWNDFLYMTDKTRRIFIDEFINKTEFTNSKIINTLLAYVKWGTGNCQFEVGTYKSWYKTTMAGDLKTLSETTVFNRIIDLRLYHYSLIANYKIYGHGWDAGILNFWNTFKQYCDETKC